MRGDWRGHVSGRPARPAGLIGGWAERGLARVRLAGGRRLGHLRRRGRGHPGRPERGLWRGHPGRLFGRRVRRRACWFLRRHVRGHRAWHVGRQARRCAYRRVAWYGAGDKTRQESRARRGHARGYWGRGQSGERCGPRRGNFRGQRSRY